MTWARRYQPCGTSVNGWITFTETMGVYGNYYFKRAVVALIGLGSNPPEDTVYPILISDADGNPTTGENDYSSISTPTSCHRSPRFGR